MSKRRLLSLEALEAYILHTVDSKSMREIAHTNGREPSTILRQVRRIEDLRDNPEWSKIITKLSEAWDRKTPIDRNWVFEALGTTALEAAKEMQRMLLVLVQTDAVVGITDGCPPGAFVDNEIMRRTESVIALAWIAVGWLHPVHNSPRVRRYQVTDRALTEVPEVTNLPAVFEPAKAKVEHKAAKSICYTMTPWGNEPIEKLKTMRRKSNVNLKITDEDVQTAICVRELMHLAELEGNGSTSLLWVIGLQNGLGKEMFDLLYAFLHSNRNLEQIEKDFAWPARSAKVVLLVALHQVQHFGLLVTGDKAIATE